MRRNGELFCREMSFLGIQFRVIWGDPLFADTLPETNIFAPKNGWLEYYFPIGGSAYFQGRTVSFREGNPHVFHLNKLFFSERKGSN